VYLNYNFFSTIGTKYTSKKQLYLKIPTRKPMFQQRPGKAKAYIKEVYGFESSAAPVWFKQGCFHSLQAAAAAAARDCS
jgi:hypothetical protein